MAGHQAALSEERIEAWRQRIRTETFANYHYRMGIALRATGEPAAAAAAFERAVETDPAMFEAHALLVDCLDALNDAERASAALRRVRGIDPEGRAKGYTRRVLDLIEEDRVDDAATLLRHALKAETQAARALAPGLLAVGGFYQDRLHQLAQAEPFLLDAFANQPDNAEAWYRLGRLFYHTFRFDKAAHFLRRAICLQPAQDTALYFLGIILGSVEHRFAEGSRTFAAAITCNPVNPSYHAMLGSFLQAARQAGEAIRAYRNGVASAPGLAWTYAYLGLGLHAAGRTDDALRAYRLGFRLDRQDSSCLALTALVHLSRGDTAAAMGLARSALVLAPADQWSMMAFALARAAGGDDASALRWHGRGRRVNPEMAIMNLLVFPYGQAQIREAYARLGFGVPDSPC